MSRQSPTSTRQLTASPPTQVPFGRGRSHLASGVSRFLLRLPRGFRFRCFRVQPGTAVRRRERQQGAPSAIRGVADPVASLTRGNDRCVVPFPTRAVILRMCVLVARRRRVPADGARQRLHELHPLDAVVRPRPRGHRPARVPGTQPRAPREAGRATDHRLLAAQRTAFHSGPPLQYFRICRHFQSSNRESAADGAARSKRQNTSAAIKTSTSVTRTPSGPFR